MLYRSCRLDIPEYGPIPNDIYVLCDGFLKSVALKVFSEVVEVEYEAGLIFILFDKENQTGKMQKNKNTSNNKLSKCTRVNTRSIGITQKTETRIENKILSKRLNFLLAVEFLFSFIAITLQCALLQLYLNIGGLP